VERRVEELFPRNFCVVEPTDTSSVSEGFLVVDIRPSISLAEEVVARLARCWWALAKASPRFATLVFAAAPAGGMEEGQDSAFVDLHRQASLRAPAPLVFAIPRNCGDRSPAGRPLGTRAAGGHRRAAHTATSSVTTTPERRNEAMLENEEDLVADVAAFLEDGPREVQALASGFASRFNTSVRARPDSPYSPDGKNDGSFKKWLLAKGFVSSGIFEHNKSNISLPAGGIPALPNFKVTALKVDASTTVAASLPTVPAFKPPHGVGTSEARKLEEEVLEYLESSGLCDMGSLRQVNNFGSRFNYLFFKRSKVNDGSWKRWLASLPHVEVVTDPLHAAYHGNQPTMVRIRRQDSEAAQVQ